MRFYQKRDVTQHNGRRVEVLDAENNVVGSTEAQITRIRPSIDITGLVIGLIVGLVVFPVVYIIGFLFGVFGDILIWLLHLFTHHLTLWSSIAAVISGIWGTLSYYLDNHIKE